MMQAKHNEHLKKFPAWKVLPYTTRKHPLYRIYVINGVRYRVCMRSSRFRLFTQNPVCVCCGLKGTLMVLDIHKGHTQPHFNLYGIKNKKLVLFTRDHMKPKSKGGDNNIQNYQTMCTRCNSRKRNRDITVEELRAEIKRNPNPTSKKIQRKTALALSVKFNGKKISYHRLIDRIGFYLNKKVTTPTFLECQEIVRRRAQALWMLAGRPKKRNLEFWLAAETELFGGFQDGYNLYVCDMEKKENQGFYRHYDMVHVGPIQEVPKS